MDNADAVVAGGRGRGRRVRDGKKEKKEEEASKEVHLVKMLLE